ncbi:MAG: hypothetical protein GMKNLPBB_01166 [Myxococcota bacterium]|nr:hypothetical protein [Myxococcota bacterium]
MKIRKDKKPSLIRAVKEAVRPENLRFKPKVMKDKRKEASRRACRRPLREGAVQGGAKAGVIAPADHGPDETRAPR